MDCTLSSFPCKYLGLSLSVKCLTKADLQPYIDKVADMLPAWKASLMAASGQLILVKAVLSAIPVQLLIAIDIPKWFLRAIDKWRISFLW